jgi:tetratricopeptide (TPR) repeat protein
MKSLRIKITITLSIVLSIFLSDIQAQNNPGDFGSDSLMCIQNLSLYQEYYKQDNYKDAYTPWKWVVVNCPKARKSTFINGENMLESMIKSEKDPVRKEQIIDTLLWLYDRRMENFNEEGFVLGKKGSSILEHRSKNTEEAFGIFKKAIEISGKNADPNTLFRYFQASTLLMKSNKMSKEQVIDLFEQLSNIVDQNISAGGRYADSYVAAKTNLDILFAPVATCHDLHNIYSPKLKDKQDDVVLLRKVSNMLQQKGCVESDFFNKVSESLYKVEPSASAAAGLGEVHLQKNNPGKAAQYFQEASEMETENLRKAEYLLKLADIQSRLLKNYSAARTNALRASSLRPDWGKPFIVIGDMYAASASTCGDDFAKQAAFWAVIDKYIKAKSVDSSVSDEANKKISTYTPYMPSRDLGFFHNLKEGDTYKIECWINESATVRYK